MARRKKPEPESNGVQTAPPPENGTEEKKRPEQFFSVPAGNGAYIEASCWPKVLKTEGKEDLTVYAVSVRKSYKDKDGTWQNTTFFRTSEVHLLQHVLRLAEAWCLSKRTESKQPVTNGAAAPHVNGEEPIPF